MFFWGPCWGAMWWLLHDCRLFIMTTLSLLAFLSLHANCSDVYVVENHTVSTRFDACAIFGTSLWGACLYAHRRSLYASPFLYSMTLIYIVYSYSTTSVTDTETEFDLIYTRIDFLHMSLPYTCYSSLAPISTIICSYAHAWPLCLLASSTLASSLPLIVTHCCMY